MDLPGAINLDGFLRFNDKGANNDLRIALVTTLPVLIAPGAALRDGREEMRDPDQRGIVKVRQKQGGTITPYAIEFRAPTAAELAVRDAEARVEER